MKKHFLPALITIVVFSSCKEEYNNEHITAFKVYCEMVANNAKPIAFHYPMEAMAIDALWNDFQKVAKDYGVSLYREKSLPETLLFPSEATKGKEVILIYNGDRLEQYLQWKTDITNYQGEEFGSLEILARRLGRLLGYSSKGINTLLRKNSEYRDLASFGVTNQITHLYYDNISRASEFYGNTLGLPKKDSLLFQIGADGYIQLHSVDEKHPKGQPKSTAIAFLTNQLPQWYSYLQEKNVPIKYTYKPKQGGAHDGFVANDPEGYLLEFEEFKQHPENEFFMAILAKAPKVGTSISNLTFFGTITWTYHKDLLKMQESYETFFGFEMVADQGWTKIYRTSPNSFIGLVDERRGMEDYADAKAIELEWTIKEKKALKSYAEQFWNEYDYSRGVLTGPERYRYCLDKD